MVFPTLPILNPLTRLSSITLDSLLLHPLFDSLSFYHFPPKQNPTKHNPTTTKKKKEKKKRKKKEEHVILHKCLKVLVLTLSVSLTQTMDLEEASKY